MLHAYVDVLLTLQTHGPLNHSTKNALCGSDATRRWKDGATNTLGSGKVKVNENKLLQKKNRCACAMCQVSTQQC